MVAVVTSGSLDSPLKIGRTWLIWRISDDFFGGLQATVAGVFLAINTNAPLDPKIVRGVG